MLSSANMPTVLNPEGGSTSPKSSVDGMGTAFYSMALPLILVDFGNRAFLFKFNHSFAFRFWESNLTILS